jgi:electron transfer flavoprotein beta subunit
MNIVVAMKQIPDVRQIRIRNRQPVLEGVPLTFGSIDKNVLELGVSLKEAQGSGKVIVVSAGSEELQDTIKEALAAGADEAYLVIDDKLEQADGAVIAHVLAETIKKIDDVDLILCGEGSGDNYSGQAASRIAELLDLPQVGYASAVEIQNGTSRVTRSLEDGEEVLEVPLPLVVTVVADINQPRIPSVTQILKAGRKPQEIWELADLGIEPGAAVETVSNLAPELQRQRVVVKSNEEFTQVLQAEGFTGR